MTEELTVCGGCQENFDNDEGGRYSELVEAWICDGCVEDANSSASSAYLVEGGVAERFLVTEYEILDGEYEDAGNVLERRYVSTDGWRGYYETRPVGDNWTEAQSGWTTGDWGDAISDSKREFNAWAEAVISGTIQYGFPVWIVTDPTSNVFSTAVGVWIPEGADLAVPAL
jgi:hypothetical protein